jgi:tetratricopeptide (TPR) repeat protein
VAEAKDIAEQVTALSFAALAFALPGAAALAPAAVSLATLLAIGRKLQRDRPEAAARRAVDEALDGMVKAGEFDRARADRALALLGSGERAVRLSPQSLIAASREADFEGALATHLADAAVGPEEPELRGPLLVVFRASLSVLRADEGLRNALTVELLLQATRDNGAQLDFLDDIQKELQHLRASYGSLVAALDDVRRLSRADKLVLAGQFERADAAKLTDAELQGFLENKAEEWRAYRGRIEAIDERTAGLGNLKAAAQDAAARLDFDEVEALLVRVDEAESESAAETKVLRAENALLRGRAEDAFRMLSAAADGFGSMGPAEPTRRRITYADQLYQHGLRYGTSAFEPAKEMARIGVELADKGGAVDVWAHGKNLLGNLLWAQGQLLGGEEGSDRLRESEAAYREALNIRTHENDPSGWATTQNDLGIVLRELGRRTGGERGREILWQSVRAYRAALRVRKKGVGQGAWAVTRNNLGHTLYNLSELEEGRYKMQLLARAAACHRSALRTLDPTNDAHAWAASHLNLGNVRAALGQALEGEVGLRSLLAAKEAYRAALEVWTENEFPLHWAATQMDQGTVLLPLGMRQGGEAGTRLLLEAREACMAALRVRTRDAREVEWAKTKGNLGIIHLALADVGLGVDARNELDAAEDCLESALQVFEHRHMPADYERASKVLADVRRKLGRE